MVPLCTNALSELHGQFAKIYRPGANDEPRPDSGLGSGWEMARNSPICYGSLDTAAPPKPN